MGGGVYKGPTLGPLEIQKHKCQGPVQLFGVGGPCPPPLISNTGHHYKLSGSQPGERLSIRIYYVCRAHTPFTPNAKVSGIITVIRRLDRPAKELSDVQLCTRIISLSLDVA